MNLVIGKSRGVNGVTILHVRCAVVADCPLRARLTTAAAGRARD